MINFTNGFYDLTDNKFKENKSSINPLNVGYDYIEYKGDEPIFNEIDDYFNKLLKNEEDRSKIISILSNAIKENNLRINIIYGPASNGKTTFIGMVRKLFGGYYTSIEPSDEEIDLTPYCDKRIVVSSTINSSLPLQKFKPFDAGLLYTNPNPPVPKFQILHICNEKPKILDDVKHQINIINFDTTFTRQEITKDCQEHADSELVKKIETPEWCSALMWLLIHKY